MCFYNCGICFIWFSVRLTFQRPHRLSLSLSQCGIGLQAAGGQTAASNEEALPHRGHVLPPPALPPGGLHLHAETQVQSRLQEARSLETLVLVRTPFASSPATDAQDLSVHTSLFLFFSLSPPSSRFQSLGFHPPPELSASVDGAFSQKRITNPSLRDAWRNAGVSVSDVRLLPPKKRILNFFETNFFKQGVKVTPRKTYLGGWSRWEDVFDFQTSDRLRDSGSPYNRLTPPRNSISQYRKAQLTRFRTHFLQKSYTRKKKNYFEYLLTLPTNYQQFEDFRIYLTKNKRKKIYLYIYIMGSLLEFYDQLSIMAKMSPWINWLWSKTLNK